MNSPFPACLGVGQHDRMLDGLLDRFSLAALRVVSRVGVVDRADRFEEFLERLGQVVVCRLEIGPQGVAAQCGHDLVGQRLDREDRLPPQSADVPGAGLAGVLDVVRVDQGMGRVLHRGRVVEGFREDAYGLDVLLRCEVLAAEHEHLVFAERPAQLFGGCVVDAGRQVDAGHLGAEPRTGPPYLVARDSGGHGFPLSVLPYRNDARVVAAHGMGEGDVRSVDTRRRRRAPDPRTTCGRALRSSPHHV
ncbi:hypothetical protein SCANM63S_09394 [Streptomyces canarius]